MDLTPQQEAFLNKLNKKTKKIGKGFIYLLESNGYYKLGRASNLQSRLNSIQVGNPMPVRLLSRAYSFYPEKDEKVMHQMFKDFKVRGEWYKLPKPLVSSIILDFYNHNKEYVN